MGVASFDWQSSSETVKGLLCSKRKVIFSWENIARMNRRSAECSPGMELPSGIAKVKNNFSIDHLLSKSDPVPDRLVNFVSGSSSYDSNCGFVSPDSSSCGAFNVDYMDNASEGPSEESFDNGKGIFHSVEINHFPLTLQSGKIQPRPRLHFTFLVRGD